MEVSSYLVADAESFELVQPCEGAFYDPAFFAQPGAVWCAAAGDLRSDPAGADQAAVLVVVVAAVGEQSLGAVSGAAATAPGVNGVKWPQIFGLGRPHVGG